MTENVKNKEHIHYTGSIMYEIELTAKYCRMLGTQLFDKYNSELNLEEYIVLDTLLNNSELCQRDIAKMIVKDRGNTSKLLNSLDEKGLITRVLSVKNNRPVKKVKLSEKGRQKVSEMSELLIPYLNTMKEKIKTHNLGKVSTLLKELRNVLAESVSIQI